MRIYDEISLCDFEPWSGAVSTFNKLTSSELSAIESELESIAPEEGYSQTAINDILWFETEFIEDIIGRKLYEEDEE